MVVRVIKVRVRVEVRISVRVSALTYCCLVSDGCVLGIRSWLELGLRLELGFRV